MRGLSVIIPAFNESKRIINSLKECLRVFNDFGLPFELIIVNDGSTDNTASLVRRFAKNNDNIKLVSYKKNKGKGHAIKYAFNYAKMNLVTFLDADLDIHPEQLRNFIKLMRKTKADIVVGSKRHPQSKLNYPWQRKLLSNAYYLMNRVLFGLPVKDTQSGLKLFKKKVLNKVMPRIIVKGYAFDLELLVVAHYYGYKIIEAPINLNFVRFQSRIGLKSVKNILIDTLGILYRLRVLKYYD